MKHSFFYTGKIVGTKENLEKIVNKIKHQLLYVEVNKHKEHNYLLIGSTSISWTQIV